MRLSRIWLRSDADVVAAAAPSENIALVGSIAASAANGADVTLDLTTLTDLQENDVVILSGGIGHTDNTDYSMALTVGTGWTKVVDTNIQGNRDCDLGIWWKAMGATPDTSVTVSGLATEFSSVCAVAKAFRNVDPTTPMDVAVTTATGNNLTATPPAIDFVDPKAAVVIVTALSHQRGPSMQAIAPPGYEVNSSYASEDDGSDMTLSMAQRLDPSDPETPEAFTYNFLGSSNYNGCSATLALRSTSAASPVTAVNFAANDSIVSGEQFTVLADTAIDFAVAPSLFSGEAFIVDAEQDVEFVNLDAVPTGELFQTTSDQDVDFSAADEIVIGEAFQTDNELDIAFSSGDAPVAGEAFSLDASVSIAFVVGGEVVTGEAFQIDSELGIEFASGDAPVAAETFSLDASVSIAFAVEDAAVTGEIFQTDSQYDAQFSANTSSPSGEAFSITEDVNIAFSDEVESPTGEIFSVSQSQEIDFQSSDHLVEGLQFSLDGETNLTFNASDNAVQGQSFEIDSEQDIALAVADVTPEALSFEIDSNTDVAFSDALETILGASFGIDNEVGIDFATSDQQITGESFTQTEAFVANVGGSPIEGLSFYVDYAIQFNTGDAIISGESISSVERAVVSGIQGGESLAGLTYCVFDGYDLSAAPILRRGVDESTDENGDLVVNLAGYGLANGDPLTIIISNYTDSPISTSRAAVCYTTAEVS